MKIPAISGDLLVKLGLGVVLLGGAAMLIYTAKSKASAAAGQLANAIDPTNPDNVAYSTINTWGGYAITDPDGPGKNADGSWTLGGFLYDISHPVTAWKIANIEKPVYTSIGGENSLTTRDQFGNVYY